MRASWGHQKWVIKGRGLWKAAVRARVATRTQAPSRQTLVTQIAVCTFTCAQFVVIVQLVSGFLFRGHCFSVPVDLVYLEKEVSSGAS